MTDQNADISQRKLDHIDLCAEDEVEYRGKTTLLEEVELLHDSLPELSIDAIDLSVSVMGKTLAAPLLITGMTGGAERAREINETLARVAQELGIAFGVGSQRAMMKHAELADTYQVREVAPDILLFGNVGAVQAAESSTAEIEDLVGGIGADALCVHLNPGQEMIQPEGDRDFRGCVDGLARLVDELSVPVIAKETGCGLSPAALDKIASTGVEWVDTSGAGGTTWVGVETLRTSPEKATIGEMFWDWGVPTGAAISFAKARNLNVIGSGGLRTGLDCARAIALGADIAGMALPWLKAAFHEGHDAAMQFGRTTIQALRVACLLTGSASIAELQEAPRVLGPNLRRWTEARADQVSPRH
ncbi:type 2 isopentenyl-diphosphate Delta-isomerase [Persicimonas caeni]|uniref:Isopentenyl-diphosphate delta-isomerase n=1 Tax=Persicimonas caeni TaxID=2292766 RepID=A0A4Y6Q3T7_PERCE|nr:type 2 isopentenyl-diphosphate Delta-isomerase [Persicimonas caeni]QDG54655.1 type 2 isopentenyl-diphosphate Delta-isomerase [Persicimonas caeni]QED35876.1 type 2 isopentenyl-diphosphate Delta-isomerase [Persicimonas caeni]